MVIENKQEIAKNQVKKPIDANKAYFIKLGEKGSWENDCIDQNIMRLGYNDLEHNTCLSGKWGEVRTFFPEGANSGSVTRHINQVQQFYEESDTTLWITFYSNRLWWCFSDTEITLLPDKSKTRKVKGEWCDTDIYGSPLIKSRLSGKLLATQSFQGTICSVRELGYLLHKINGTFEPHVAKAVKAIDELISSLIPIIKNLHPKDLETLTDLIFRQAGWQRTGVAGEVEKDIDLDLLSPITQERIAIQIKSTATENTYAAYKNIFLNMTGYSTFYFITHSPDSKLEKLLETENEDNLIFWGVEKIAQQSVRAGLMGWLIDKAS